MQSLDPLINLLVVLSVLSVAAERITNLLKLRNPNLRSPKSDEEGQRIRETAIQMRTFLIGIGVAIAVKADFFEIMTQLENPWRTLGWVHIFSDHWSRSPSTDSFGTALYTLGGCIVTGTALGFGSKFWHDVLGIVFELRDAARRRGNIQVPAAEGNTNGN